MSNGNGSIKAARSQGNETFFARKRLGGAFVDFGAVMILMIPIHC